MACDGFEGRFYAGVVHEGGERRARLGEPVGVEGNIFVGFDVEEVCAADGECAGGCCELDHFLGRVGGVAGGNACGVAVFVGNVVAFFQVAEFDSFPGAAALVGDVLALWRVVCVCHLCSSLSLCLRPLVVREYFLFGVLSWRAPLVCLVCE